MIIANIVGLNREGNWNDSWQTHGLCHRTV